MTLEQKIEYLEDLGVDTKDWPVYRINHRYKIFTETGVTKEDIKALNENKSGGPLLKDLERELIDL
ncbi:MAG: hypothetical protein LC107_06270 [Chitinophagales bacterium]|nr:hypothetical protein [Chitinophagales bacterium]